MTARKCATVIITGRLNGHCCWYAQNKTASVYAGNKRGAERKSRTYDGIRHGHVLETQCKVGCHLLLMSVVQPIALACNIPTLQVAFRALLCTDSKPVLAYCYRLAHHFVCADIPVESKLIVARSQWGIQT
jgi:hypothetical protein